MAGKRGAGWGRALHRKSLTAAKGTLEVLANLPDFARQGLFAKPGTFETWVRLSNGGMDKASDRTPDTPGANRWQWPGQCRRQARLGR